ncbi:MAG: 3,5-nucleoside bisphosphate phosphatase [Candidatus Sumerlaeota bacterium]|nr:3,5-nucleoside bisphosphate phosphatase [Candidatus Sumerlaeota bacterium]
MSDWLIDLHCHTKEKSFDGKVPAAEIVARLGALGFHGVVFTDHAATWQTDELEEVRREAGVGPEFLLLAGQEVRTKVDGGAGGDLLVYGPADAIADGTEALAVFEQIRACGGFCVAAHPSVPMIGFGRHAGTFPVAGLEVWNGRYGGKVARRSVALAETLGLPGVGGSDTHVPGDIGGGATLFTEQPQSLEDIRLAIEQGTCREWRPPVGERLKRWLGRRESE